MYVSASQIKSFLSCEACALAELTGQWVPATSSALMVGSYVDAYFAGELGQYIIQHPDIFTRDHRLKAQYEHANRIIERIERDASMMRYLGGDKQVIMTGYIDGIPAKVKIDSLLPDATVDLKVMSDMAPKWDGTQYVSFIERWGYDLQGAIYQRVRAQNDGGQLKPFILAVATKEAPEPDIALIRIPQSMLDAAWDEVCDNAAYIDGIKRGLYPPSRCEQCPYCRATKQLGEPIDYDVMFRQEV